ncbi:MAG TPA: hypothetical protein PLD59_15370 [Tepidisphaeraceae bacterium]|nr:hypothetical protein [Tepidisphaeraceae bacterium]
MTKTVYRTVSSKRFSSAPRRGRRSVSSFNTLIARLDNASARLKASRKSK